MIENKQQKKFKRSIPILILAPIITAICCIGIGKYFVSIEDVIKSIYQIITGVKLNVGSTEFTVINNLRLPRIILAIIAGVSLTSAGCAFQAVFSNPLAAPDTLGVSAGAGLGACIGLLLGYSSFTIQLFAFMGGVMAVALTFFISQSKTGTNTIMLILGGIAISAIFQSGISMVQMLADPNQTLPEITYWLMGSLSRANYLSIGYALPAIFIGITTLFLLRWKLNTLSLSEHEAIALGIPIKKLRTVVIVAATLCTASVISLCGMIGWIGILGPHMARMIFGSNNKYVLPAAMSIGATALIIMDTLSRNLVTGVLPISVLTALVGAPVFIILLRKTGGARL